MAKYKIIREDWFDHEDTTEGYYDSLEEAQEALKEIREKQTSEPDPKDSYSLYEIPQDGTCANVLCRMARNRGL